MHIWRKIKINNLFMHLCQQKRFNSDDIIELIKYYIPFFHIEFWALILKNIWFYFTSSSVFFVTVNSIESFKSHQKVVCMLPPAWWYQSASYILHLWKPLLSENVVSCIINTKALRIREYSFHYFHQ